VRDEGELARALRRTLAPDRAAEMASAAWGTVSEGAEVTDTVIAAIAGFIDPGAGR
jgi:3-deoxy-D-manno-octulosonic-acid transferase